jgi:transcriptional regulator with XRE-family HTH domain
MLLKPKEKLKNARKSKFTQAEFSELIAMDTSQYNRREKGRIPISDDEWLRFAKALNMNVNEIIETDTPLISITHNHEENDHTITNYEIKISLPKNIFDLFNAKFDAVIELNMMSKTNQRSCEIVYNNKICRKVFFAFL